MKKSSEKQIKISDTIDEILECYHERWSVILDNIFELLTHGKESKEKGYKDSAFMIYAANNGYDYKKLFNELFDVLHEEGVNKLFEHFEKISNDANGIIENKLLKDCQKLCLESEENLRNYISNFLKNKVNEYLRNNEKEVVRDFFSELENNFENAKTIIGTSSSSDEEKSVNSEDENLKNPFFEAITRQEARQEDRLLSKNPSTSIAPNSLSQIIQSDEILKEAGAEI